MVKVFEAIDAEGMQRDFWEVISWDENLRRFCHSLDCLSEPLGLLKCLLWEWADSFMG